MEGTRGCGTRADYRMRSLSRSWNSVSDRCTFQPCITDFFFLINKKCVCGLHPWFLVQEFEKLLEFPEGLGERIISCYANEALSSSPEFMLRSDSFYIVKLC